MLVLVVAKMLMLVVARMLILVATGMLVLVVPCPDRPLLSFWEKLFAHPNVDFNYTTLLKRTVAS